MRLGLTDRYQGGRKRAAQADAEEGFERNQWKSCGVSPSPCPLCAGLELVLDS